MNIRAVTSDDELLGLRAAWDTLFAQDPSAHIFVSWAWCSLWWKHFGGDERMLILVVEDDGRVVGIAPLMETRGDVWSLGRPVIRFLGHDLAADYMDFLITDNHPVVVRTLIDYLFMERTWARIDLRRIQEPSATVAALQDAAGWRGIGCATRVDCVSPSIYFDSTWDAYYGTRGEGLRGDLRNSVNKLKRLGSIKLVRECGPAGRAYLDRLYAFHRARQDNKVGRSIFESARWRSFLEEFVGGHDTAQWVEISAVELDSVAISCIFGLRRNDSYYDWIASFQPEYGRTSVMKVHLRLLLEELVANGLKEFDFMIGDEGYKYQWANRTRNNLELRMYRNTLAKGMDSMRAHGRERLVAARNHSEVLKRLWYHVSKMRRSS
jgi:CelD/BcsL family acetyltransferase involved in cellulose biosynthesis